MPIDFNPRMQDLIMRGHASRSILDAVEVFCDGLTIETIARLSRHVNDGTLAPEQALAVCHEIAAYRRIVDRLKQAVTAGEKADKRQRDELVAARNEETFA